MDKIVGRENIKQYWQDQLDIEWKILDRRYSGKPVQMKILQTLIHLLNYRYRPQIEKAKGDSNYPIGEEMAQFRILLIILDELIEHGWNRIDFSLKTHEIPNFWEKIWRDFQKLGWLKHMLSEAKTCRMREMRIFSDVKEREEVMQNIDSAIAEWENNYRTDEEWLTFYYKESTIGNNLSYLVKEVVENTLGFSQNALIFFNTRISKIIGNDIQAWKEGRDIPFGYIKAKRILDIFRREVPNSPIVEDIDESTAIAFLREIEYAPGKRWSRSPFVKVQWKKDIIYVPVFYFLYASHMFASSWLDYIIKGSKVEGAISKDWGALFEKYVIEKLKEFHSNLTIDYSGLIVNPSNYPDIKKCLGGIKKTKIEIDIIAHTEKKLYLISCKSKGSYTFPNMMTNLDFLEFQDLDDEIDEDYNMAGEIENYARCIRESPMFLKANGFEDKEVVPLVVTATFRPLSLKSVQHTLSDYRTIPKVQIIQALNLSEYTFQ